MAGIKDIWRVGLRVPNEAPPVSATINNSDIDLKALSCCRSLLPMPLQPLLLVHTYKHGGLQ